ncbi:FeoB-associated Cys-rich membrane protein [Flavobacterium gossypii]|nr:FeoB-associated Cys-rich membrane protein [Flavobacterium gossypii]
MNIQEIIVYLLVAGSMAFLIKKFFWKKKKKAGNCGNDNCGCH